jgi:sugar lactone lactonase YvrE
MALLAGNLYGSDTENSTIRKVDLRSTVVSTVAGTANISGTENDRGTAAHFNLPTLLATDGKGALYIADTGNSMIRKMTIADMRVITIGGQAQTEGKDDGPASKSTFGRPRGLATDGNSLWVADTSNQLIRKIDLSSNTTSTIAGKAGVEGKDNGPGASATFDNPGALATDGKTLYVADADNHAIRKINLADNTVTTLCEVSGHIGSGLAINRAGNKLYLSDTTENSVAQVDVSNGTVSPFFPK